MVVAVAVGSQLGSEQGRRGLTWDYQIKREEVHSESLSMNLGLSSPMYRLLLPFNQRTFSQGWKQYDTSNKSPIKPTKF